MTGWKNRFAGEFVPEWCAAGVLVLLAAVWTSHGPVTFTVTRNDFLPLGLGLGVMTGLRALAFRRAAQIAEYFTLTLAASKAICVLSYLCLASAGPLQDSRLMAMDIAVGFDWLPGYQFLGAHPWLKSLLGFAYDSLIFQGLYFCVLLGLMNRKDRLRDMFWLFLICGLLACLGTLLLPALGPSKFFNIDTSAGFVPVMEHLLSGRDLTFALSSMKGVVSFPSFHTAMALAYVWAFRGTGPVGWAMAGLNLVMLCSVPYFDGHYLMDMIAGAAAMLLSLALVKAAPALRKRLSDATQVMPVGAAARV